MFYHILGRIAMFRSFFLVLIIAHVLGDFYFQSNKLAEKKQKDYRFVLLHSLLYFAALCICIIPFWSISLFVTILVLAVAHLITDSCKFTWCKRHEHSYIAYFVDQVIHVVCIAAASAHLTYNDYMLSMLPTLEDSLTMVIGDPEKTFFWVGLTLLILKPANVTIKQLTDRFKPTDDNESSKENAGALIGSLERLIAILFISIGQYAAIGLILTAKSVARYNKISESKQFAEYYLLGTLASLLYAVLAYYLVF